MQAPIQKTRNSRCRKTFSGPPLAERDELLRPSDIKRGGALDNYLIRD